MNTFFSVFLSLLLLISTVFAANQSLAAVQEDESSEENEQTSFSLSANGLPVLQIDVQRQKQAGIEVFTLPAANYQSEFIAYGRVLDLKPLLHMRGDYFTAAANYRIAAIKRRQAEQNYKRVKNLQLNKAASMRKLQQQKMLWEIAKAHYQAEKFQLMQVKEIAVASWGKKLAEWLFKPNDSLLQQTTLIEVSLPARQSLPLHTEAIHIAASGSREQAVKATLLSAAPYTRKNTQGETYYFQSAHKISSGMSVSAWIPEQQAAVTGVMIPASAVIWHLGQQYVYLKTNSELFTRKQVTDLVNIEAGYFSQADLMPGHKLVIKGVQLLLSEELRGQIPDEDEN